MNRPLLVVPDVNVLVSGSTISHSPPSAIINAWRNGKLQFATSELILQEAKRVFTYPRVLKFTGLSPQEISSYLQEIRRGSKIISTSSFTHISPDHSDDKFFAVAVEAHANCIISGDIHHVLSISEYQGIPTMSPQQFVTQFLQEK